jgi:AmmeMemoRadiSam system protein B
MKGSSTTSSTTTYVRRASHAGSWYSNKEEVLSKQLAGWLKEAATSSSSSSSSSSPSHVRAIIAPHAGYSYSGPTAAYAYMHLDPKQVRRIFILGPSHHVYLKACAVSGASICATPVGDLEVDNDIRTELLQQYPSLFQTMRRNVDEDEHSIEMHLPYVAQVVGGQGTEKEKETAEEGHKKIKVVPIMVGAIDPEQEAEYGKVFATYLEDPGNFFIISSDFCHWGSRFRYQPFEAGHGETIADYIEWLDHEGMRLIEEGDPKAFTSYLKKYENTICGRHPIAVFMHAAKVYREKHGGNGGGQNGGGQDGDGDVGKSKAKGGKGKDKGEEEEGFRISFVRYAQSSRCQSKQDSSVSYASAVAAEK